MVGLPGIRIRVDYAGGPGLSGPPLSMFVVKPQFAEQRAAHRVAQAVPQAVRVKLGCVVIVTIGTSSIPWVALAVIIACRLADDHPANQRNQRTHHGAGGVDRAAALAGDGLGHHSISWSFARKRSPADDNAISTHSNQRAVGQGHRSGPGNLNNLLTRILHKKGRNACKCLI